MKISLLSSPFTRTPNQAVPLPSVFPVSFSPVARLAIYLSLSSLACAAYLSIAQIQNGEFGFPLDDSWIHQVYARNIGTRAEFSFFAGQPSAGSTSPLWALLLGIGYALQINFRVWVVLLGIVLLALIAWLGGRMAEELTPSKLIAVWLVPIFLIFEWHLVWAAVSGMEILLFIFLSLALLDFFFNPPNRFHNTRAQYFILGAIAGLLTLTRPEGIVLGCLVALGILARAPEIETQPNHLGSSSRGFSIYLNSPIPCLILLFTAALVLLPYLAFNFYTDGTLLPNTFYAKSQEYAELLNGSNFFVRLLTLYRQPLIGAQILLVPGLFWLAYKLAEMRKWELWIPLAWILLLPALYASRLPVEYQFGRYMMPIIPFIVIYGVVGTALLVKRIPLRLVRRVWEITIAVLLIAFFALGAQLYAGAVAIVNCEMVATARWTAKSLPPGQLLAVHDIGAQGYFDSHPFLDLAGLVSPEVIPFIRDEGRILKWMKMRGVAYAIFFPDWYPRLNSDPDLRVLHSENCSATHLAGGVDLSVYELKK